MIDVYAHCFDKHNNYKRVYKLTRDGQQRLFWAFCGYDFDDQVPSIHVPALDGTYPRYYKEEDLL